MAVLPALHVGPSQQVCHGREDHRWPPRRLCRPAAGAGRSHSKTSGKDQTKDARITANTPHNQFNQMNQTLSWFRLPLVPETLTSDTTEDIFGETRNWLKWALIRSSLRCVPMSLFGSELAFALKRANDR